MSVHVRGEAGRWAGIAQLNSNRTLAGAAQTARWRGLALREGSLGGRVQPGVAVPWARLGSGFGEEWIIEGRRPKGPCFQGPFGTLVATPYQAGRRSSLGPILGTLLPITAAARLAQTARPQHCSLCTGAPGRAGPNQESSIPTCITPCQVRLSQEEFPACHFGPSLWANARRIYFAGAGARDMFLPCAFLLSLIF